MSKYYMKKDVEKLRFFQVPKVLFERDKYKDLGVAEKMTYGVLLDRTMLSMKNDWFDEKGYAYILFSGETLGEILNVHEKTARRYINNLKKFGLLEEKRMGRGLNNRIYLVQPDYLAKDIYKDKKKKSEEEVSTENKELTEKDNKSYPQAETIENNKKEHFVPSRRNNLSVQEGTKCSTNDTDFSETDFSDTQSFYEKKNERMNDNQKLLNKIFKNANVEEMFLGDNYLPVKRAIENLVYRTKPLKSNCMFIPIEKIKEDLLFLDFFHIQTALQIYEEQSAIQKINNRVGYLSTLIYNSIFDTELKVTNDLKFNNKI